MPAEVRVPEHSVPVAAECDVLVCGGGPAGIATAISAARHGCGVILLERWPSVGGMATNALVNIWHTSDREKQVIYGLVQEAIERGGRWVHRWSTFPKNFETHWFDPERMRVVFHQMLAEAGVRTFCNVVAGEPILGQTHEPCGACSAPVGRIRGVLADTKRGRRAFLARIVVDATGDGDVAAKAGLPFDYGRESDGRVQGMTMMYRLCGVDNERLKEFTTEEEAAVLAEMRALRDHGEFPPFNEGNTRLRGFRNRCIPNMCPVAGNPLDEEELTWLTARAREQVFRYLEFWRTRIPAMVNAEVEQTGFALGVRESRRIRGRKTLTREMVVGAAKQPDAIGHGFWLIDIHDPQGTGYTTYHAFDPREMPPPGQSYHIPLGMCLNDHIPNLMVAGRCASSTHEGHASVRLQSHCMVMGQGVGTAAALALSQNVNPADVNVRDLQETLRKDGVYIEDVPEA